MTVVGSKKSNLKKSEQRQSFAALRQKREVLADSGSSARVNSHLRQLFKDLGISGPVLSYQARSFEVPIDPFFQDHIQWAYPRVEGSDISARRASEEADFETSSWGIKEPKTTQEVIDPRQLKAVLVPAVAFDRRGGRLGSGKGFYDRFLKQVAGAHRIGVAFSYQVSPSHLEQEPHDEQVEWVVTDQYILHAGRKG